MSSCPSSPSKISRQISGRSTTRPAFRTAGLRPDSSRAAPDHFRRYNDTYAALRFDNHLGPRVTELVRLATAQTTRCPVCMAGRHPDAIEAGLTEELVAEIGSEQPTLMSPAEVAAVGFALKFSTDHLAIDASDKAALREHFTPEQIVEIGLLCVMCLVGRFSMLAGLEEPSCPT